ncbi:TRAP transporter large permease [Caldisericum exile]|uniref:TRAP transporter large membrane protein n=1 Tax=Caldisericum exile (strain DSM 21853 / NBRC 104410 / AZM16c01) TaxID=511051 RepID=A0A7U6GDC8_CALEA|nr:TRAP transporter large permease [Caldisericum exile]BAL80304.1 TRAP transporter large membrane protein [Caldisericum exile AZM16c01]
MSAALILFGIFILLIVLGAPIGTAIGVAGVFGILKYDLGVTMIAKNFSAGIAKFPLIAIPFFVLEGELLSKGGLAKKISNFIIILVGKARGGLAMAAVVTAAFWGAISGSGPATAAAIGLIFIPAMIEQGYHDTFAASVVAAASGLAIIIPPSIAFIVYGNITGVSVGALFLGGILPGLVVMGFFLIITYIISRNRNYHGIQERGSGKEIWHAFKEAIWAILAPVIILGSIYAGIATPTESAIISVFYSLFVGLFVYKSLGKKEIIDSLIGTAVTSAVVMFVVTFAGIFSITESTLGIIGAAGNFVVSVAKSPIAFLLLVDLVLFIAGFFLDAISILYVIMPIFLPVLQAFKIDPLFFGVMATVALAIGQITPPVAVNLYVTSNLIKKSLDQTSKDIWPYVAFAVIGLLVITLLPKLSLLIPIASKLYTP